MALPGINTSYTILYVNALVSNTGSPGWDGGSSAVTVLNAADFNNLISNQDDQIGAQVTVGFDNLTLGLNQRIAGVRLCVYDINNALSGGATNDVDYKIGPSGGTMVATDLKITGNQFWAIRKSSWYSNNGVEWTQTTINNLQAQFIRNTVGSGSMDRMIDYAWIEVDLRTQPSTQVTSPGENSTGVTTQPTVQWIFTGYNGAPQKRYQVKIFSQAQYQVSNFDPTTSSSTYSSGWLSGTTTTHTIATSLSGGTTYRAYVQSSSDFGGVDYDSGWDYNPFTTVATPIATVISPTGTLTTTNKPLVIWTFTASGGAQSAYRVKTFTAAQYGIGGFDPETSPYTEDSGEITGTALQYQTTAALLDGAHRAYVKAAYLAGSSNVFSAWVFTSFTIAVDKPATPSVPVPTVDSANARVSVALQGNDNMLTLNQGSLESGTSGWVAITNCTITQSTTVGGSNGSNALRLSASSAATMSAGTLSGTSGVAVAANTAYIALASFRAGTTGRTCRVWIDWYNSGGTFLSASSVGSGTDTTGAWTQVATASVTSPGTAAFARVTCEVVSPASAELHYVDSIKLAPGSSTTWTRGGLVGTTYIYVEWSDDAGATWTLHGETPILLPTTNQATTLQDYRSSMGIARIYRAYVVSGLLTSATSANSTSATLTVTSWWLKDPSNPLLNITVQPLRTSDTVDFESTEQMAVYKPLGRKYPIVVTDVVQGVRFELELEFTNVAAWNSFSAIRDTRRVLLLMSPLFNTQWWVKIGSVVRRKVHPTDATYCTANVPFIEVSEP